jgi:hypothetical protein
MIARVAAFVVVAGLAAADDLLPPEVVKLARIEHAIAAELNRMPNYTCAEVIERSTAEADSRGGSRLKRLDRLEVDVAVVNGHDLYAWPGHEFQERSIIDMVDHGFVSDGDFSVMLHNVFTTRTARKTWVGPETQSGRRLLRYDFEIPVLSSGWHLLSKGRAGTLGSKGSFWVDADSLQLVRMRFAAEDMPAWSPHATLEEDIQYAPVSIGDSPVLLPALSTVTVTDFSSHKAQNAITFTNCRRYAAESSISFGDDPVPPKPPRR